MPLIKFYILQIVWMRMITAAMRVMHANVPSGSQLLYTGSDFQIDGQSIGLVQKCIPADGETIWPGYWQHHSEALRNEHCLIPKGDTLHKKKKSISKLSKKRLFGFFDPKNTWTAKLYVHVYAVMIWILISGILNPPNPDNSACQLHLVCTWAGMYFKHNSIY